MNTQVIGFNAEEKELVDRENLLQYISHVDLKSFGLIPELIGRLPVLTYLKPLDLATLKSILTDPKNSLIKQYTRLLELENIKLTFTDGALAFIAETALDYKLGARGLRSICEAIMTDAMYELPSQKEINSFEVDRLYAESKLRKSKLAQLKAA